MSGETHELEHELRLTLDELGQAVALALSAGYEGPANGQVRAVPDRRAIRYYTTLGLIDRPAEYRGRTALYGRRHLLQLVAIKKLQAQGRSLAEIQAELTGAADGALAALAAVPEEVFPTVSASPQAAAGQALPPETRRRASSFWSEVDDLGSGEGASSTGPVSEPAVREVLAGYGGSPAGASSAEAEGSETERPTSRYGRPGATSASSSPEPLLTGVPLAADLTLLLLPQRALSEADIRALRDAAAPLIRVLETRGLLGPTED